MSLFNLLITAIFALECYGFTCPPISQRSHSDQPVRFSNGTAPHTMSLTGTTSSGQTVALDLQSSAGTSTLSADLSGNFSLGGTEGLSYTLTHSSNGSATVKLHYGSFFTGIKDVTYNFQNNLVSGNIDGRVLNPVNPSSPNASLTFADGHGPPSVSIAAQLTTSNLNASLEDLRSRILSNDSCDTLLTRSALLSDTLLPTTFQERQSLDYSQDPGHSSNTDGSVGCIVCTTEQALVVNADIARCVGICSFLFFTSDCPNCWKDLNNLEHTLSTRCEENFCCPIDCGTNCCDLGEHCLSPASGLCCSGGESPCGGKTCCEGDQVCMGDGSCCPTAAAIDGECCPQVGICGTACCGLLLECMAPGLCCVPGSVVDGGICCGANQYNDGGQCCDVGTSVCGSTGCCAGTCTNGVCTSTSNGCLAAGGSGDVCTTNADCPDHGTAFSVSCLQGCCFYEKNIP
jgi:hypothetical protein